MAQPHALRDHLLAHLAQLRPGTLRIWGRSCEGLAGRTLAPIGVRVQDGALAISFAGGESLLVWDPHELVLSAGRLSIANASRVRWEWFFYGREHLPEALDNLEFRRGAGGEILDTSARDSPRIVQPAGPAIQLA